jgi:hypothetical protein
MNPQVAASVKAAEVPVIAINTTHRLAPWADALYSCDAKWWMHNQEALRFEGLKITQDESVPFPQVYLLKNTGSDGFDPDPSCLRTGHNSTYQALQICIHAKAKRVLLCGVDMRWVDGETHWHGDHPAPLADSDPDVFRRSMIPSFNAFAPQLPGLGVEVINCTPGSALFCFPRAKLEEVLCQ